MSTTRPQHASSNARAAPAGDIRAARMKTCRERRALSRHDELGQFAPETERIRPRLMGLFTRLMVLLTRSKVFLAPLKLRGAGVMTKFGRREHFPGPVTVSF